MTGFGTGTAGLADIAVSIELRSVNGKGHEARLRYPPGHDFLDQPLRQALKGAIGRGSIQISVTVERTADISAPVINRPFLHALAAEAEQLTRSHGAAPASADGLLAIRGVVETADGSMLPEDRDSITSVALAALAQAVSGLIATRISEGKALREAAMQRIDTIEELARQIADDPSRQPDALHKRLTSQVAALIDAEPKLDAGRLHAEAALLATKADIDEELDRLRAHVGAVRNLLAEGGAVGRKLDFLAQEFNREANTICSKANAVAVTNAGLEMKMAIDQFREQIQNLE
jgi:uncharacterized protein (TIGR00255 family)